ncbi:MAG: NAD(P)-binding protein [Thermoanaerobaculia bacterium]|jgi:uncharacterized protein with NAD-binding domain and iron-sulfur cluster
MKKRIAVLGGGCGSMAAVWALTQLPKWDEQFDITVYQMGWRLGGKCASGRDEKNAWRILEHGLHVWGGFYENSFRMMRQAYDALPADTGATLPSLDYALTKLSTVILQEQIDGKTINWELNFPENDDVPGSGGVIPSVWEYVQLIIHALENGVSPHAGPAAATPLADQVRASASVEQKAGHVTLLQRLFPAHFANTQSPTLPPKLDAFHPLDILAAARHFAASLHAEPAQHLGSEHDDLLHLVEEGVRVFVEQKLGALEDRDLVRRARLVLDFSLATVRGILRDGVLLHGWEAVNDREWRDWLREHGASQSTIDSALVRGIYDYVFGFVKGVETDRALEAGTGTHGLLRLFFTYKGAMFWEMQAGMGDVVFAPLYRALIAKGVKFEFFQKATKLAVTDGAVAAIEMETQANAIVGCYQPLVVVNGVFSWPAHPRYDQLVEGEALRRGEINLESAWTPWKGTPHTLERGRDFDDVILGISLAALSDIAAEVSTANRGFATMLDRVKTVQTASMQLWLDADADRLGASLVRRSSTAGIEPVSTWSDMSFLLAREQWPPDYAPRFIAYFCGEFADAPVIPPYSDHEFPQRMLDAYRRGAIDWLKANTGTIWSRGTGPDGKSLDWALLHDPENRAGEARLDAQFLRVNIDPTERYVASFPDTSRFRLSPDTPVLANLYITGDWVKTAFNAGCVEAAIMAGLAAARAISGASIDIIGG